ncbi:MAG: TRAP transporter substrate-binding protein DctP [Planctomycetes bacterium]|nr:TRAP transporter substrate-binding protein DctP [Planctomycetota bacterium]
MKQSALVLALALAVVPFAAVATRAVADDAIELKVATLAPEGSTWMGILNELDKELRAKTGGKVGFKYYPGGVTGDEKLVVKKLKIGQLQGAGLTNMGVSELVPHSRILDVPFLYRNRKETEAVRATVLPRLEQALEKAGYVSLGWADAGPVHLFSTQPIRSAADLRARKVWVWEGDAVAETSFRATGVTPIPLALPDVLTSLQTGLVDTVYISPVAAIALQWFTKVHYMTDSPIVDAVSLMVVQKKAFDKIAPENQRITRELSAQYCKRQVEESRKENEDSVRVLKEKGIELVPPDEATRSEFNVIADKVSQELVGKIYDQALLDDVKKVLAGVRAGESK